MEQPPSAPLIHDHQRQTKALYDTATGDIASLPGTAQTVVVTAIGQKLITTESTQVTTIDGTIVADTSHIGVCRTCRRGPFSTDAVVRCQCGSLTCKACAGILDKIALCKRCYRRVRIRRWWRAIWQLS